VAGRAEKQSFVLTSFEPAYVRLHRSGELAQRARTAVEELSECCVCPRRCRVNRLANQVRVCGVGRFARVSSAFPHFGEEDCLRGRRGSGTIFFSGCNLKCVFCQNWDISQRAAGRELRPEQIAELMLQLQAVGCHNINLVTPEHVVPQVLEALAVAADRGLRLPLVYNTSAYDSLRSLELLDGVVDIYMPDFKFWRPETARRLAKAPDYPDRARAALKEMHRQVGPLKLGPDGTARRGVLVRHLVLPGLLDETEAILQWLAEELSRDTFVNIMAQYHPDNRVGRQDRRGQVQYAEINRPPTADEIRRAFQAARRAGLWRFDWEP